MKIILKKQFILTFVSLFFVAIVTIIACKKDEQGNVDGSSAQLSSFSQLYDSKLIESFRNEPAAKEFLRDVSETPVKVVNGILSFKSAEDINRVYDLIIKHTDNFDRFVGNDVRYSKYGESEQMPEHIMSYLFESKLDFYSLRADIEEQVVRMERGDGISDDDDPDDHYTVSPYWRTLLSPKCEVIIDDLICVYYDTYGIGIMNLDWKTLDELHQYQNRNNFDETKALEFCAGKQNAFFLTPGNEPAIHVDFAYTIDLKTTNTVQFVNYSNSEAYKDMSFLWDFGDGTTSTEKNPKHTFQSMGVEYLVSLTVSLNNSRAVSGSVSEKIIITADPNPRITYNENTNGSGDVGFSIMNVTAANIFSVTWNFGDGGAPQVLGGTIYANHTYTANGSYTVSAEILYNNMVIRETFTKKIEVKHIGTGGGSCCAKGVDREVETDGNPHTYNGERRRVKQVIRVTNIWPFHHIAATTKVQFQNKNGKWKARKVEEINVGATGLIFWQDISPDGNCKDCNCPYQWNLWKGGETSATTNPKRNASQVVMDRGSGGGWFKVTRHSLWSQHYVKDGIVRMHSKGDVAVHDESCN